MNNRVVLFIITALFNLFQAVIALSISNSDNSSIIFPAAIKATSDSGDINENLRIEQNSPEAYIDVYPNFQAVSSEAGSVTFSVSTDGDLWTVSDDADWLTATKTNATTITVTYQKNTSTAYRNGNITAHGPLKTSETVILMQDGADPFLDIVGGSYTCNYISYTVFIDVNTNVEWSVSDDASWFTTTKVNESYICITIDKNLTISARDGTITATGTGGVSDIFKVYQTGAPPFLTVTPDQKEVTSQSGSTTFSVASNVDWTIMENVSWLTATKTDGNTISVSYDENTSSDSRSANITAYGDYGTGSISYVVTLIQSGATPFLSISPSNTVAGSASGYAIFNVTTNVDWTVTDDASWVNATKTDANTVTVTFEENLSTDIYRTANIIVSGIGVTDHIFTMGQYPAPGTIDVTPDSKTVGSAAGSTTFNVSANFSWTIAYDASHPWLTGTKTNENTLSVSYTENTSVNSRTATISAGGNYNVFETVSITQSGASPYLDVSPNTSSVGSASGSVTFSVSGNVDWTVTDDGSWLTAVKTNGNTITVNYDQNSSVNSRTANISVTGTGGAGETVSVTQSGASAYLDVSPNTSSVGSLSGSVTFSVSGNVDWTVTDNGSWLVAIKTGDSTISVSYDENTSTTERSADITANGTGGISEIVTIRQYGASAFLDVTPDSMNIGYGSGTASLTVSGNVDWSVSDDCTWLIAEKTGDSTITVNYDENTSENERSAHITAYWKDTISVTITIKQDTKLPTDIKSGMEHPVLVYPNPVKDYIYLKTDETSLLDISVSVTDAQGRLVYMNQFEQFSVNEVIEINLSDIVSGIYYVSVRTRNMNLNYKIIKE